MPETEVKTRKPDDTAFKQQRLRAWQPILTPRTVLPTLFLIGIIFAPLGGFLLYISNNVSEVVIDYTDCYKASEDFKEIKSEFVSLSLPGANSDTSSFQFRRTKTDLSGSNPNKLEVDKCTLKFTLPADIQPPVFLYYQLTNFYQNHRRYVKSVSYSQLQGNVLTGSQLATDCDPLSVDPNTKKPYFPCGLIANSMFNDTIHSLYLGGDTEYEFSSKGISWESDLQKYKPTNYTYDQVVPPPNWVKRYPDGQYTAEYPPPDLTKYEHLQVWMRTAGLPNFRKLYGKLDSRLPKGDYELDVDLNFDTTLYHGRKAVVISTVSFLGGKNPYLGLAYLILGGLCVILGIGFTARHLLKPRKLGDSSYLSWNQANSEWE